MIAQLPTLVVAEGATASAVLRRNHIRFCDVLLIKTDAALVEAATVQVTDKVNPAAADWYTHPADLTAGQATEINVAFNGLRVSLGTAAAADREFVVTGREQIY